MSFRTAEPALKDVLDGIASGQIQLPDFQRGWVWDDDHIRSLIASLSLSYPIGAVMLLEAGNIPFKPRLFSGVDVTPAPTPKTLVLDGQQRLTSMYLALRSGKPVPTRTHKNVDTLRVYFLDMKKCLDPNVDREEAIISVPVNLKITQGLTKKLILDVSTPDLQYSQYLFPASLILDTTGFMAWERGFSAHHQHAPGPMSLMQRFRHEICMRFELFKIPAIELSQKTPREAVCQVFEKVNNKGVTLSVFELMTATFASSNINLRDDWDERRQRMTAKHEVLKSVDGTAFLTAVTLLASYQRHKKQGTPVSCKRSDVFDLTLKEFQKLAPEVEKGFIDAANLLAEQKIFDERTLPYPTQLVPLAALHAELGKKLQGHQTREKLLRWFWSGVMGELYGSASETRFSMDMQDVVAWLEGGDEPRTIRDADFSPTRLLSLQNRLAAAYKGLTALLMQQGSRDFVTGTPMDLNSYFNNAVDVHHIFPRAWCTKQNLPRDKWNSVVNKAPLASSTNRFIGGTAPSTYLGRIQKTKQVSAQSLGVFLSSHVIPMSALQSDDFDLFLRLRAAAILDLIEKAMGKPVVGRDSASTIKAFGGPLTLTAQSTNGQLPQNAPSAGKTRQSRISLADLDIHPGAELSFSRAPAIKAVVLPNNQIQYGGKTMSLSSAAVLVLRSMGKKSQVVSGSAYWMYEGESLGQRRQRLEAGRAKAMAAGAA